MSNVINFRERTNQNQLVFPWLVYTFGGECFIVDAMNPLDAMYTVTECIDGPAKFTCVIPQDDAIEWRDEWDNPPEGWTLIH